MQQDAGAARVERVCPGRPCVSSVLCLLGSRRNERSRRRPGARLGWPDGGHGGTDGGRDRSHGDLRAGADAAAPARRPIAASSASPGGRSTRRARGWTKMEYRRGDVRDAEALGAAFEGADVVVHLAFLIVGGSAATTRAINVEGTLNAFRAAAAAGARRFVYASSIAAYGFHRDNPVGIDEDWPTRAGGPALLRPGEGGARAPAQRGGRRAPGDRALPAAATDRPGPATRSAARSASLPRWPPLVRGAGAALRRLPGLPVLVPDLPLQLIHQEDVAEALRRASSARGRPVPTTSPRTTSSPAPTWPARSGSARWASRPVPSPPRRGWPRDCRTCRRRPSGSRRSSHPAIMDTTKARTQLGWRPRHTAIEALRSTLEGE